MAISSPTVAYTIQGRQYNPKQDYIENYYRYIHEYEDICKEEENEERLNTIHLDPTWTKFEATEKSTNPLEDPIDRDTREYYIRANKLLDRIVYTHNDFNPRVKTRIEVVMSDGRLIKGYYDYQFNWAKNDRDSYILYYRKV
jgi:hypothetical protein